MLTTTVVTLLLAAQDPAVATVTASPGADSPWRLGLGVGAAGDFSLGLDVVAERRLDWFAGDDRMGSVFLGLSAAAGASSATPSDGNGESSVKQAYSANVAGSMRKLFNTGDPLEVSTVITLSGSASTFSDTGAVEAGSISDSQSYGVDAAFGITLEHWFTPAIGVRAASPLIHGGGFFTQSVALLDGTGRSKEHLDDSGFAGGLSLAPSVALMVAF